MIVLLKSGGQTGSDVAGLKAAKELGIKTGGMMPKGFKTLNGPRPEYKQLYNIIESEDSGYRVRTYHNVRESDGTIRFATNFFSAGEICTKNAIRQYGKPYFDVHIRDTSKFSVSLNCSPKKAAEWIKENNIKILNCAGNSELSSRGIEKWVFRYMKALLGLTNGI